MKLKLNSKLLEKVTSIIPATTEVTQKGIKRTKKVCFQTELPKYIFIVSVVYKQQHENANETAPINSRSFSKLLGLKTNQLSSILNTLTANNIIKKVHNHGILAGVLVPAKYAVCEDYKLTQELQYEFTDESITEVESGKTLTFKSKFIEKLCGFGIFNFKPSTLASINYKFHPLANKSKVENIINERKGIKRKRLTYTKEEMKTPITKEENLRRLKISPYNDTVDSANDLPINNNIIAQTEAYEVHEDYKDIYDELNESDKCLIAQLTIKNWKVVLSDGLTMAYLKKDKIEVA